MIRWGVVGAGGFASRRSIPGLKQADNCHLCAIDDVKGAKELAETHTCVFGQDILPMKEVSRKLVFSSLGKELRDGA